MTTPPSDTPPLAAEPFAMPGATAAGPGDGLTYLYDGFYGDLDWNATLDYMTRRFVQPLQRLFDIESLHLADCAAGFGWLAFAWLRAGGRHATLIEPDAQRLEASRLIARQLGLEDRCSFVHSRLEELRVPDESFDVFACIETLEHVSRSQIATCVSILGRAARCAVVVTTPNLHFPVIAHDTRLPGAHWLPKDLRRVYARWFGRLNQEQGNDFLSASDLDPLQARFAPTARFQTFATWAEFKAFYPHYLPYNLPDQRQRHRPHPLMALYVWLAGTLFGRQAYRVSHNLANIWLRRPD